MDATPQKVELGNAFCSCKRERRGRPAQKVWLFSKLFRARLWFAPGQLATSGKDKDSQFRLAPLIWVNLLFCACHYPAEDISSDAHGLSTKWTSGTLTP
jgi:hypothetical protein